MADRATGFSPDGARRVVEAVRQVEQSTADTGRTLPHAGSAWGGPVPFQSPAGGLGAGASATCTRMRRATPTSALSLDTGNTATVRNDYGRAVGASKLMWCVWFAGVYSVIGADC